MEVNTRLFGKIVIEENKIITMDKGMIGYPNLKKYTLIVEPSNKEAGIFWLQSLEEPELAFLIINPLMIKPDYQPTVEDDYIQPLGELTEENMLVFSVMTVPADLKKMSINLKAPIIINSDTCKGCQIIVEDDIPIKFPIYQILEQNKEG